MGPGLRVRSGSQKCNDFAPDLECLFRAILFISVIISAASSLYSCDIGSISVQSSGPHYVDRGQYAVLIELTSVKV